MKSELAGVRALTFDVFGTVVDWRGSIAREVRGLKRLKKRYTVATLRDRVSELHLCCARTSTAKAGIPT